ncbi:MAG: PIG-L family deacetylase [Actinomycetes bacterium]
MSTLVCFHAHPDDEAMTTGGTIALASDAGHRVVLVVATRGEEGEVADGVVADGVGLGEHRSAELEAAALALGIHRVAYLDFRDSGMAGEESNLNPECFAQQDVEFAARRLADILIEESADVLTVYDEHGGYGHPDHIQVHRVGIRAGEIAGTQHVYEATIDRDHLIALMKARPDDLIEDSPLPENPEDLNLGVASHLITTRVDVTSVVDRKRAAMAAHASQIPEDSFFLNMPVEIYALAFGTEWFTRRGAPVGTAETSLPL